jgi:hypothetical protein
VSTVVVEEVRLNEGQLTAETSLQLVPIACESDRVIVDVPSVTLSPVVAIRFRPLGAETSPVLISVATEQFQLRIQSVLPPLVFLDAATDVFLSTTGEAHSTTTCHLQTHVLRTTLRPGGVVCHVPPLRSLLGTGRELVGLEQRISLGTPELDSFLD